jgi:hypothetical protein
VRRGAERVCVGATRQFPAWLLLTVPSSQLHHPRTPLWCRAQHDAAALRQLGPAAAAQLGGPSHAALAQQAAVLQAAAAASGMADYQQLQGLMAGMGGPAPAHLGAAPSMDAIAAQVRGWRARPRKQLQPQRQSQPAALAHSPNHRPTRSCPSHHRCS